MRALGPPQLPRYRVLSNVRVFANLIMWKKWYFSISFILRKFVEFVHIFKVYLYFLFCDLSGESVIYKVFLPYNFRQDTKTENLNGKDGHI